MKIVENSRSLKMADLEIGDVFRFDNDTQPFEYYQYYMVGEKDLIGVSDNIAGLQFKKADWYYYNVVKVKAILTVE